MRNENPFIPNEVVDRAKQHLPASHPMCQDEALTQLQAAYLPALMWLFDVERYRAQGRTTLLAHVAIKLAMQGETVYLEDLSAAFTRRSQHRDKTRFADVVLGICNKQYPGHRFEFTLHDFALRYRGRHPQ